MSSAWAGGVDAIIERIDKMTELFIKQTQNVMYKGESAEECEECGEPIPLARRKAIACRYCVSCQTKLERK